MSANPLFREITDTKTVNSVSGNLPAGIIFYLIGASGSGKDSLLSAIRSECADDLLVAHRYITRDASAGGENHVALSEAEFQLRQTRNMFAMSWQAHGLHYGIGVEITQWLNTGMSVVVNGSRAYLASARALFGQRLIPIVVCVEPEVLEARLRARGRECEEEIALRLQRAAAFSVPQYAEVFFINNSGTLSQSVSQFWQLKNSLVQSIMEEN